MGGKAPHTPHEFARPPALLARFPGYRSRLKTRRPRLSLALPPFFGITWRPLHEGRIVFIGGTRPFKRQLFLCKSSFRFGGKCLHVGGGPPNPPLHFARPPDIVHGIASRFWGGDILPLAWARRIRAKRFAALTRGRGPKPPPCFCPPTHPFCCGPLLRGAEGRFAFMGSTRTPFFGITWHPLRERRAAFAFRFPFWSESFGILCTKDASPSLAAPAPSKGNFFYAKAAFVLEVKPSCGRQSPPHPP